MKKRVLIVDDDKDFLEEFEEILNDAGYDVICTGKSSTACALADEIKPDIILLDLKMPSMTGFEVASELKGFMGTFNIPIIAISGAYTKQEHSYLARVCGIRRCLNKPINPEDLIVEIEKAYTEKGK